MRPSTPGQPAGPCFVRAAGCIAPGCGSPEEAYARIWEGAPPRGTSRGLVGQEHLSEVSALTGRVAKRMDRFSQLAVAAARSALAAAGTPDANEETGVVVGNMTGGWTYTEPELRKLHTSGLSEISPYLASAWFPAAAQGQASIQLGLTGFAKTVATDRCAGGQAIGLAISRVAGGRASQLLAGGAEAPVTPFVADAYRSRFGDPDDLTEAAAFLLLGDEPSGTGGPGAVRLWGSATRTLFADMPLVGQVAEFLGAAQSPHAPDALLVNSMAHQGIEEAIRAAIARAGWQPGRLVYTNRVLGDALGAAAPLAAVAAYEATRRRAARHVVVLSVGHQCLDIFNVSNLEST